MKVFLTDCATAFGTMVVGVGLGLLVCATYAVIFALCYWAVT